MTTREQCVKNLGNHAKKGFYSGTKNPFYGKHHTEEAKLKISQNEERSKKLSIAFKGRKCPWVVERNKSPEMREKVRLSKLGKPRPKWIIEKLTLVNKGRKLSEEHKAKLSAIRKGRKFTEKHKMRIGKALMGERNGSWNGGTSKLPYPFYFDNVLKTTIRTRDDFTCQECSLHENQLNHTLNVHHIDYDKHNIDSNNLISLCNRCHSRTVFDREMWTESFRERLVNS